MLPAPKRFLQGRGAARFGCADARQMSFMVSGWVDSLEGVNQGPALAGVPSTVGGAVGP